MQNQRAEEPDEVAVVKTPNARVEELAMVIEALDTIVTSSLITSRVPAVRTSFRSSDLASLALLSLMVENQLFFAPHPMSQPQSF